MKPTRVLIIDDEKQNVRYLTTILEENGFTDIHAAFDGVEGLEKVESVKPGLILLDLRMPRKNGIMVFNDLRASNRFKDIPVIILTGEGELSEAPGGIAAISRGWPDTDRQGHRGGTRSIHFLEA